VGCPALGSAFGGNTPAVLAVDAVLHQDDKVVIAVQHLDVYPNGFTINVVILTNPHNALDRAMFMRAGGPNRWPRVGVRFSDGKVGGQGSLFRGLAELHRGDDGIPTEPHVGMAGGGGGSNGWRFGAWVFPLPPDGQLEIFVGVPAADLDEASVTIDGSAVRSAAEKATVIWS
jgi:hypothetical protein